ncbi:MAG TPA: hypothetical protein VIG38_15890 [Hyphomicrobium sp.]|jgi:hypothetical protein
MQAEAMTAPQGPEPTTVPSGAEARLQRNLKLVVIGLAVLLFAGLATIVGRVIYLASGASTQPAAPSLAIRPEQSIGIPAGAQVRSVSLSGDRLAVHFEAAGTEGIAVLDLQTGQTITTVGLKRTPAN